jgi:hypothetical protein
MVWMASVWERCLVEARKPATFVVCTAYMIHIRQLEKGMPIHAVVFTVT